MIEKVPVTAAVLAGGRSLRMGVDKVLLPVDGQALVARVVEAVSEVCAHTLVVTNRPETLLEAELPSHVCVLADEVPYQGPLGGLVTALASATDEWVLAVAADMPHLSPEVVRALWDAREGAQVVVPVGTSGPEPLLALYSVSVLPVVRGALEAGKRRLVSFFPELAVVEVPLDSLRTADPGLASFINVNTPEDLVAVRECAESPEAGHRAGGRAGGERVSVSVVEVGARRARGMPSERPITLYMNDVEIATVQATPTDLEEMAVGFMVAEGLLADRAALRAVEVDRKRGLAYVSTTEQVPADMVHKTRYVTSGCGKGITFSSLGHARGLAPIDSAAAFDSAMLYDAMGQMSREAVMYRESGGTHACGLVSGSTLVIVREDVGRHNALDKVFGRAWLDGIPTDDAALLSTGRVSYEMAVKAARARVALVVSRSAVTDLAAEIADRLGITLAGYARGGKFTVYTHPHRVCAPADSDGDCEKGGPCAAS